MKIQVSTNAVDMVGKESPGNGVHAGGGVKLHAAVFQTLAMLHLVPERLQKTVLNAAKMERSRLRVLEMKLTTAAVLARKRQQEENCKLSS